MSDEKNISDRYRELPREEPPPALDDAILAASRRAVKSRNRWYVPLAAAAVIVLAVAVTLHVERQQPGEEIVVAPVEPAKEVLRSEPLADQAPPAAQEERKAERAPERQYQYAPQPKPAPQAGARDSLDERPAAAAQAPRAPAPAAEPPPEVLAKRADEANAQLRRSEAAKERGEVMARAAAAPSSRFARATPEQWLLAIDDLKRQGKHDEAARELAEFRKRHPDYRIPEAITEKFETR